MTTVSLNNPGSLGEDLSVRIALVSDLHVKRSSDSIVELEKLWSKIVEQKPDIILLAGDYINDGSGMKGIEIIGPQIAQVFTASDMLPVVAVLGNHDYWSGDGAWRQYLSDAGVTVLENETVILDGIETCIRGFGDAFTGNFRYVDFPKACRNKLLISLMHDPAGAFHPNVEGIVLAGHTHCGQVSIPFLASVYTPSSAPKDAQCGLFQDEKRVLFVSAGVGTSVIPLRFNTQSSWDLITIYD
ncbi:metallophosphoesterase [Porticoccaceae bacterium]|nr:metallophosphoesterase [Porticoccaceae bacterium]